MNISIDEFNQLHYEIQKAHATGYEDGVRNERERELPNNFFEALIQYAEEKDILVDYHRSTGKSDGCNWVQVKPTRSDSSFVGYIEISFEENLMEIDFVGVGTAGE